MTVERLTNARFTEKSAHGATVEFSATGKLHNAEARLYVAGTEIARAKIEQTAHGAYASRFSAPTAKSFDFETEYVLEVTGLRNRVTVSKSAFVDTPEFIKAFETAEVQNLRYGAIYSKKRTVFRVWAPLASKASVMLYDDGATGDAYARLAMSKRTNARGKWSGVWELTVSADLNGKYYTYDIKNNGVHTETIDPYAKACGVNGMRGMVIDLSGSAPGGWADDKHLYETNARAADTPIVWEIHVGDFSASPDSGMKYKGKYLAFTEENTTVPGRPELKTGLNYLKELGVTYVQLNPVYDFATVDEGATSVIDNGDDNFNWGYDPQNYNIPEGAYATDPASGAVRINEFKRMVMALHKAGIGVIMDVVYNHTYTTIGQALHDTVPYYYHRTNGGTLSDLSGCGNDTASERAMMRKYIVDSIVYWATEYHIDGFRFDLMGIHDRLTVKAVRDALDALDDGAGRKLLMYGEPWTGEYGGNSTPKSFEARVAATQAPIAGTGKYTDNKDNTLVKYLYQGAGGGIGALPVNVAVFNDKGRDGLRGNNDLGKGWANGGTNIHTTGMVQNLIEGGCGSIGHGMGTGSGSQNVAYASAHDNYTLFDQIIAKPAGTETPLWYEMPHGSQIIECKAVASAYLMSSGIAFMLAGEEMGRTKYGNHNSYNSPIKLNCIEWARQELFVDLFDHYKQLIRLRKDNHEIFSYEKSRDPNNCYGIFSDVDGEKGTFTFTRRGMTTRFDPKKG